MSRRKKHHHKLNSRKQREKVWVLQALIKAAASRPVQTCRKETWEERMAREKAERAQQNA